MAPNPQIARKNSYENTADDYLTKYQIMCKNTQKSLLVSWARRTLESVTMYVNFLRSAEDKYFKLIILTTTWLMQAPPSNQHTYFRT